MASSGDVEQRQPIIMVDEVEGVGLQHFDTSPSYWCFGADLTSIGQRSGAEVYLREEGVCKVLSQNIIIIFYVP